MRQAAGSILNHASCSAQQEAVVSSVSFSKQYLTGHPVLGRRCSRLWRSFVMLLDTLDVTGAQIKCSWSGFK